MHLGGKCCVFLYCMDIYIIRYGLVRIMDIKQLLILSRMMMAYWGYFPHNFNNRSMDTKREEALESKASIKETATSFFVVTSFRSMVRFSEGEYGWDVRKGEAPLVPAQEGHGTQLFSIVLVDKREHRWDRSYVQFMHKKPMFLLPPLLQLVEGQIDQGVWAVLLKTFFPSPHLLMNTIHTWQLVHIKLHYPVEQSHQKA